MYKPVEQATRDEVKACLLRGLSMRETMRQCGVTFKFVAKVQRTHNLPKTHTHSEKCSASTIQNIQNLYAQGKTRSQIAAACNVSLTTVTNYRLKQPIPLRGVGDAQKQQMIQLALGGASDAETARICKSTTRNVKFVKFLNDVHSPGEKAMCDQDTVEKIQKQLRAGEPFKKIAADCGVSARLVEMVKLKFGINYYHKTSDDKMDKIAKCIVGGMSALMTAKMCGVSTFTIRKVCKSRNLTSSYAKRLTPAIKEEMKRRLDQGETCEDVAKAYSFSLFSVRCIQKAANRLQSPSESAKEHCLSPIVTESEIQKIQDLLRSGMSLLQVAIASNRSKSTVFKIKSKMHLYRQPAHPPVANLEEIEVPSEQVEVSREERKDSTKMTESPGASIATVKYVNYESNAQTQPIVKQEQVESPALFTEIAPGSTSAVETMASVKFLNEIPFCVLI